MYTSIIPFKCIITKVTVKVKSEKVKIFVPKCKG